MSHNPDCWWGRLPTGISLLYSSLPMTLRLLPASQPPLSFACSRTTVYHTVLEILQRSLLAVDEERNSRLLPVVETLLLTRGCSKRLLSGEHQDLSLRSHTANRATIVKTMHYNILYLPKPPFYFVT